MHQVDLTGAPADERRGDDGDVPALPFDMAVLPNGLTLIVHEDRRNPLVCTHLCFNVGSKDEPDGRTGFAHLFEHLMFKASANRSGNWHNMLQAMGGTGVNGTTSLDRTNYFQTVPKGALDRLLWMESDRMGHLLDGISVASLADEVSVVKNEKRQREGAPYQGVFEAITTALYPREHPYGHTVLGSFVDLDNADMETVGEWYARWYGASNAVLVIVGDIGFEEVLAKVRHWFGSMPAGTPVRRITQWLPDIRDTKRITLYDRVPFRRVYSIWSTPAGSDPDSTLLRLAAQILASGSHSRLVKRLVDREKLCLGIGASQDGRYLCGEFHITAALAPGVDPALVEAAITEELGRLIAEGPTQAELDRVRRAGRNNLLRMLDSIDSVAETLAVNMIAHGRPDVHMRFVEIAEKATPETIRDAAARWLSHKALEVDVRPFEAEAPAADPADRTVAPMLGTVSAPPFPEVEHACLANGLKVQFARRPGTHGTDFALHLANGSKLDPPGSEGLSRTALLMMAAGTARRSKRSLAETFAELGIDYKMNVRKDSATLLMSALKGDLAEAMGIMAEIITQPSFPGEELSLQLGLQLAGAKGRGMAPAAATETAIGRLIFGATHDYGRPGDGTEASLASITRDMIVARHRAWLDPARAALVVVGDFDFARVMEMAEASFGGWSDGGVAMGMGESVWAPTPGRYFIERPGGPQSALRVAMASPGITIGNEALIIFNSLFGGAFGSRLNANLRERRGWTYGANSGLSISPQIGAFHIVSEVQGDRTMDALAEIERELAGLAGEHNVTSNEIEEARQGILVGLPGRWADNGAVVNALIERIIFDLPDDYHDRLETRLRSVGADDVDAAAGIFADPAAYSWVVAGDVGHVQGADFVSIDAEGSRL